MSCLILIPPFGGSIPPARGGHIGGFLVPDHLRRLAGAIRREADLDRLEGRKKVVVGVGEYRIASICQ